MQKPGGADQGLPYSSVGTRVRRITPMFLATAQGELVPHLQPSPKKPPDVTKATKHDLIEERKTLATRLATLQLMIMEVPWANWQPIYDQIGARYEAVKAQIATRP
jgi:hypothetical protein